MVTFVNCGDLCQLESNVPWICYHFWHLWTRLAVPKGLWPGLVFWPQGFQSSICVWQLTLGGSLAVGSGQGDHALVHLDPNHHASALQVLREELAVISLLVHGLVEEDDAADAGVDPVVGREEELAVQPPVLLCVLGIDALEALGHAAWGSQENTSP